MEDNQANHRGVCWDNGVAGRDCAYRPTGAGLYPDSGGYCDSCDRVSVGEKVDPQDPGKNPVKRGALNEDSVFIS